MGKIMPQVINVTHANIKSLPKLVVDIISETSPKYIQLVVDYSSLQEMSVVEIDGYLNKLALVVYEALEVPLCSFCCHLCKSCVKLQPEVVDASLVDKHGYITQDMKNQFYRSIHEVLKGDT